MVFARSRQAKRKILVVVGLGHLTESPTVIDFLRAKGIQFNSLSYSSAD
jgi:uncharacterized protein YbaP (TraB family)